MPDKERVGRFLRTLLGTLTVASLVVALASPPSPIVFSVLLVPAWLGGMALAAWLVFRDGWDRLAESSLYAPRLRAPTATLLFVGIAVVLKVAGTAGANSLVGEPQVGYGIGLVTSGVALVVAYAFAFWAN
jgi:hypothetical protein